MTVPVGADRRGGWRGRGRGPARIEVRSRIALIAALAVALAVVLVAVSAYIAARNDLLGGVTRSLARTADQLEHERAAHEVARAYEALSLPAGGLATGPVGQVVGTAGVVVARTGGSRLLPVTAPVRQVAAGRRPGYLVGADVHGTTVQLLVRPFGTGLALELAAPVGRIDAELGRLAAVLAVAAGAGVVIAVGLGAAVSGLALRPVRRLTAAAEEVAATRDLARRIPLEGRDELSRLAASINTLLAALERSQAAQRQLVADASHELRTPLASLRTNVELLAGRDGLDTETKGQLATDVVRQFDRVGRLVGDLIELARHDDAAGRPAERSVVALDVLVGEALDDLRLQHPRVRVDERCSPCRVRGVPADLARVVANLVDNAAKWSPEGGTVTVRLEAGPVVRLVVADDGPGIDPADLPHVFDRFYRGRRSAPVPGSGLGLAIVRGIVQAHGGSVDVDSRPGEGTRVEVRLPASP